MRHKLNQIRAQNKSKTKGNKQHISETSSDVPPDFGKPKEKTKKKTFMSQTKSSAKKTLRVPSARATFYPDKSWDT